MIFKTKPTVQDWLKLDKQLRIALMSRLGIPRSGGNEMVNNVIVSDGVTANDLEKLNIGNMINMLGTDSELFVEDLCDQLFLKVINKFTHDQPRPAGESKPVPEPVREPEQLPVQESTGEPTSTVDGGGDKRAGRKGKSV